MKVKRESFDARLPATPCDVEMRDKMIERAATEGVSLAELQRSAFALFLRKKAASRSNYQPDVAQE